MRMISSFFLKNTVMYTLICRFCIDGNWDSKCRYIDVPNELHTSHIGKVIFESGKAEGLAMADFYIIGQVPLSGWVCIDMEDTCAQVYRKCGVNFCGQRRVLLHIVSQAK